MLLSSVVQDDNAALSVNLANPDVHMDGVISLPRDTIAIERTKFLWQAVCYERIGFRNYADSTRHFRIDIGFGADFRDLFEIRGTSRVRRGTATSWVTEDGAGFHYEGLDNLKRKTELRFWPPPSRLETNRATFEFELAPKARTVTLCLGSLQGQERAADQSLWTCFPGEAARDPGQGDRHRDDRKLERTFQ